MFKMLMNENVLIWLQLWRAECQECLDEHWHDSDMYTTNFQTLKAFSTPQLQLDKYVFIYQLFVALKKGHTPNICTCFVWSY